MNISPASRAAAQEASTQNGSTAKSEAQVVVKIDNESDPFATVVTVEFGDYLGELVDTVRKKKKHRTYNKTERGKGRGKAGKGRILACI